MASVRNDVEHGAPVPVSNRVGAMLHRARLGRGGDLSQAARDTRIPSVFLRALEEDAPITTYPAPVYARHFVREYAQYLDLEADPLVEAFDLQHDLEAEPAEPGLVPMEPRPRRWPVVAVTVVSIAAAVAIFLTGQRPTELESLPSSPVARPTATAPPQAVAPPSAGESESPPPRVFDDIQAVARVSDVCWIRATADGEVVMNETISSGRLVFRAEEELLLELGSGGNVRLTVNGEPVDTGAPGEVVRFRFEWRDGELIATTA